MRLEVFLRNSQDEEKLKERIRELEEQNRVLRRDLGSMSQYAERCLRLEDELRDAKKALHAAGLDTSFIKSIR